ncbi:MAG: DUF3352 domain-containing protein [Chloroflexi bacterium]|nr:DUF3352 domain-containing protein [Chloroflexota bacterium]
MRKLVVVCMVALLMLSAVAGAVLATPVADLTALAQYFPENTVLFAAFRTDEGFIETLDGVIGQARDLLPPGAIPPFRLNMLLDQAVSDLGQGSFRQAVRPWLGDTAAIGLIGDLSSAPRGLLAVAITDRDAATAFVKAFLEQGDTEYDTRDRGGYTLFTDPDEEGAFAIGDDVLFLSVPTSELPELTGDFISLGDSPAFTGALALLPADEYNGVAYLDMPTIFALSQREMAAGGVRMQGIADMFAAFADAVGPQVYGFTILDGRSLVMDAVQQLGDTAALEAAGMTLTMPTTPVDPSFAANIPADAPLVVMGTELNTGITAGFQNLRAFGRLLQEQARALPDDELDEDTRWLRDVNVGNAIVAFTNLSFAGVTGLNLEQDVLPWMGGNYAAYLRLLPLPEETDATVAPDFAVLVEATDSAGPQTLVEALGSALEQYGFPPTTEDVNGTSTLVFGAALRHLYERGAARERLAAAPELDLLIGGNDNLFIVGSRPAVVDSLMSAGDRLADAPAFIEAQTYALDGAQQFWYLNTRAFVPVIDTFIARETSRSQQDMREARVLAGLFSSGSISTVARADGGTVARFVLTLAQDPLAEPGS